MTGLGACVTGAGGVTRRGTEGTLTRGAEKLLKPPPYFPAWAVVVSISAAMRVRRYLISLGGAHRGP